MEETSLILYQKSGLPTVARMQQALEEQKQWRTLLTQYVKAAMVPERHYYSIGEESQPALTQDGARLLAGLYEVHQEEVDVREDYAPDGHYSVRATVRLVSNRSGQVMAVGTGSCSTRESRYAWRWVWPEQVPIGLDKQALKKKTTKGGKTLYQCPNPDLADQYNTVLKMAEKRAHVAATLRLPYAAEVFGDAEPVSDEDEERKGTLALLRKWMGQHRASERQQIAQVVFGCSLADIAQQSTDALAHGWYMIQKGVKERIDWSDPQFHQAWERFTGESANKAASDLFEDDPPPVSTAPEGETY